MGVVSNIKHDKFPAQSNLGRRVEVCFHYDTKNWIGGELVRADAEAPWVDIIKLDDGRYVLTTECQYHFVMSSCESSPSELEMHKADYNAIKSAGFESPGESILNKLLEGVDVDKDASIFEKFEALKRHWYLTALESLQQRVTEQDAREIGLSAYRYWMNNCDRTIDNWVEDEVVKLLNKLNREPHA